jgi:hypothetical protein
MHNNKHGLHALPIIFEKENGQKKIHKKVNTSPIKCMLHSISTRQNLNGERKTAIFAFSLDGDCGVVGQAREEKKVCNLTLSLPLPERRHGSTRVPGHAFLV